MSQLTGVGSEEQPKGEIPREIHIWEFPAEFYVQIEPTVAKELVSRAAEAVGGMSHLARVLKKARGRVYDYRASRIFMSIASLLKLCNLAKYAIEQVEPHIIAYKGGRKAKPIRNPHLPLVESPDLYALMGHLAGDGGHAREATYTNTREALIDEFLKLLHVVFGEVFVHVELREKEVLEKDIFQIRFGLTIIWLLGHLFHIDFRTHTARVPPRLFELPCEYASAYLRAFGDDEGYAGDMDIRVGSANKQLLQDIYALVRVKFPELREFVVFDEPQRTHLTRADKYFVRFRIGALASYKELIGFNHPEKRQELDHVLARRTRGWTKRLPGTTQRMLLQILSSTPMTVKALARQLTVTRTTVRDQHLKSKMGLITLGFVRVKGKKLGVRGGAEVYELTEQGRKFLQLPELGLLGRARRSTVMILQTLARVREGLTVAGLARQVNLSEKLIHRYFYGRKGRKIPGLLELGLVERSGRGRRAHPHVYRLTDEGHRVVEELTTLFPVLFAGD